jgi:hypothetical protein
MSQALAELHTAHRDQETDLGHATDRIRDALRGLRFGTVAVIVQDGVIVQIERTEKLRLGRAAHDR